MEFVQEYQLIFADPTLAEKTAKVGPKQADTHDAGRPRQPDPQEPLGDVALRLTAPLTRRTPVMFPIPPYTGQDPAAGWPSSTPAPGGSIEPVPRWPWPEDRVSLSHAARRAGGEQTLSPEEQRQIDDLKQRDQEVKAHERAHMAAGAGLVSGGASYEYQRGPDGKMYAVGGEVQIDVSAENDPDATIRKMQQVRRAAMAPAQPSGADRSVAAQALQLEMQARVQKQQEQKSEEFSGAPQGPPPTGAAADPALADAPQSEPAPAGFPRIDIQA
jgi:hypothetical protein